MDPEGVLPHSQNVSTLPLQSLINPDHHSILSLEDPS
jgi:hypothetical protein